MLFQLIFGHHCFIAVHSENWNEAVVWFLMFRLRLSRSDYLLLSHGLVTVKPLYTNMYCNCFHKPPLQAHLTTQRHIFGCSKRYSKRTSASHLYHLISNFLVFRGSDAIPIMCNLALGIVALCIVCYVAIGEFRSLNRICFSYFVRK